MVRDREKDLKNRNGEKWTYRMTKNKIPEARETYIVEKLKQRHPNREVRGLERL